MTIATGDYVLTKDATAALDAGADGAEYRDGCGLLWSMSQWRDSTTGELDDVLHVVHRQHGRLNWTTTVASNVGRHHRLGRADCNGYLLLCGRELAKNGGKTDQRIFDLIAVLVDVLRGPREQIDLPGVLEIADAARAGNPELEAAYQRMSDSINRRRIERGAKPLEV